MCIRINQRRIKTKDFISYAFVVILRRDLLAIYTGSPKDECVAEAPFPRVAEDAAGVVLSANSCEGEARSISGENCVYTDELPNYT